MKQTSSAVHPLRVLVVDDSVDAAEALSELLAAMGCSTVIACDGAAGIEAAARFEPHLALIDLEMPGLGGCEVAQRLRANATGYVATLVCLTGRGHLDDRRTCISAGFDEFFTKPMSLQALEALVAAGHERSLR